MDIYRIVDRETNKEVGVYMQPTARDEYNFSSVSEARRSNCHGIYEDKAKYKIRKYKLVLVDDDCDPATEEDFKREAEEKERIARIRELTKKYEKDIAIERFGFTYDDLNDFDRTLVDVQAYMRASMEVHINDAILG